MVVSAGHFGIKMFVQFGHLCCVGTYIFFDTGCECDMKFIPILLRRTYFIKHSSIEITLKGKVNILGTIMVFHLN